MVRFVKANPVGRLTWCQDCCQTPLSERVFGVVRSNITMRGGMLITKCGFPSELATLSEKFMQRYRKDQLCIL